MHFTTLDPAQVSAYLYNTAVYLIQNGDVIEDGHTLDSIDGQEKWPCQHEDALVGPEREVVEIACSNKNGASLGANCGEGEQLHHVKMLPDIIDRS